MSEDDPFADLGEALSGDAADADSSDGAGSAGDDAGTDVERDPMAEAAFPYEAAVQRPFYAREDAVDSFDSWLNYELERELDERGYRNIVVREMTDALLRTVVEEDLVDEVAERFERAREDAIQESDG